MEATYSSSSSSSSSALQGTGGFKLISQGQHPFHGSLHSVRKPLAKPWKKPIAPLPPTPPRVYRVDPVNFRDLVQKLTGAPQFMSQSHQTPSSSSAQRLQRIAPSPLKIAASSVSEEQVSAPLDLASGFDHTKSQNQQFSDNASNSSFGLNLSPSSYNWCNFSILSPGTLSSLDLSTAP
ncbi:hypothetical protein ERO13_A11G213000v2 [Gossypium hirsutum]|uniref:VQ motif-containing protein 29 n=1 Tax=Gossypium hirsutum TaxID=3635 RepID=A0A1U8I5Q0_GOSHI|nr:VQ motif-containing protein 29-like [Gossypium hirsutum]KAG4175867.1 hypothetical protein ERO13_A11G213000v2 [Gossypium hirsutum]